MKIRRFTDIEKEDLMLNEAFDFSDDNDGIEESIESAKLISGFDDLCWKLLDSFYQFISVHYGDPEWFYENYSGYEYLSISNDKFPFINNEIYLTKSLDHWKLTFTGKFGVTERISNKSRMITFVISLKNNYKNEFLSYNNMMRLLDEARTSRDYKIIIKWIDSSNGINKASLYPWSIERGRKNIQCIRDYTSFCNDYINSFLEATKTPYKDIDKVRDLEGYKKKFTDLLYNFFTWLDINGKYPKFIGRRGGFKFDFKEYGIPHMVLHGSNIFFTKNTSAVGLDSLYTMIHVNGMSNHRDYWCEALKGLGKFNFSWAQVCLEGGSVNIFYEVGEALEKFVENEKAKLRSLKESFDFENDDDYIDPSIEKIKASRILVDFLDEMEDDSVRMHPEEVIKKLNDFVNACSNGKYQVGLRYNKNDKEEYSYWINVRRQALFKSFYIFMTRISGKYISMENIARCAMWIYACLFDEPNKELENKIDEYAKKYKFSPKLFDFEWTKDQIKSKYSTYLKESFDFDSDNENTFDMVEKISQNYRNLKTFNELFNKYIIQISWQDIDDITRTLNSLCNDAYTNQKFSVRMESKPESKHHHAMKNIILTRLSDGKEYTSNYSKADIDQTRWLPLHHFLHLMCIVGTCLFDRIPNWWDEFVKTARKQGWNLFRGKEDIDTIYQSYFENQE